MTRFIDYLLDKLNRLLLYIYTRIYSIYTDEQNFKNAVEIFILVLYFI